MHLEDLVMKDYERQCFFRSFKLEKCSKRNAMKVSFKIHVPF